MPRSPDLVIRNGTLADGTGGPLYQADVAITDGKIVEVGSIMSRGAEEIDARGKLVTPGFVDIHTHYDGQVMWSQDLTPSSQHGVTTVIMGNCGVGFAPCRPHDHDRLVRLMEGVEDIPEPVLTAGLPWNWESFPDYMEALAARSFDVDVGAQLPHAALRVYVMGERGANREPATATDSATMAALAGEAMRAGALGFTTSRTLNHRTSDGQPTPTLKAGEDELLAIAEGMAKTGSGVLQFVLDLSTLGEDIAMMLRIVEATRRPLSFSVTQHDRAPERWRETFATIGDAVQRGLPVKAQVAARAVGLMLGHELSRNPFNAHPSYIAIAHLPLDERVRLMRQPEVRAKILGEQPIPMDDPLFAKPNYEKVYLLGNPPDYEQPRDQTLAACARRQGCDPAELAYDAMLEDGGRGMLYVPFLNYADGSLEPLRQMMRDPNALPGLSDGGAHCGIICDASFPTYLLTHWTRDRTRGAKLSIEEVVAGQTRKTAEAVGLFDRGVIAPGYKADLNVIDYDRLTLHVPEVHYDLPTGGRRLVQQADGYVATIVSGAITRRHGVATGARPGQLIRGAQTAPASA